MEDTMDDIDEEMMDSENKDEEVPLTEPSKAAIHNKEGLLKKLEDIVWLENADCIHRLTIDYDFPADIDVNDDLAREMSFYTQALDGTQQAFEKLQALGLPFLRLPDYYAKMVKSDSHMLKIKGKCLEEKKKIEEAEERKKARESKIIAKEVQAQKNKERAKRKKEDIESVKKWRKQRQQRDNLLKEKARKWILIWMVRKILDRRRGGQELLLEIDLEEFVDTGVIRRGSRGRLSLAMVVERG